jgi:hypothetical protein
MSAEELFVFDRARLRLVTEADSTGYIGTLEHPAQACRVVFLAAELGAIGWDESYWPELEFGVWCDEPAEQPTQHRRRRAADEALATELSTWLQLRRSWPQLGGPSIPWPLPTCPPGPAGFNERLTALVATAVEALNTTYRRTLLMARALAGPPRAEPVAAATPPPPFANGVVGAAAGNTDSIPIVAMSSPVLTAAPQAVHSVTDPVTRTFVATAVAATEYEIGDVLGMLVRNAEANAMRGLPAGQQPPLHLDHTVIAIPTGPPAPGHLAGGNGLSPRFLVTLTATHDARRGG